ncbi:MAG TPA: hypothetical protein PLR90_05440 [Methylophilus sp.]|nr:hypothetical protein [Methylophilus sp.]HQQ33340.1 hypothetical protein [Methylophilus sp.]
MRLDFEQIMNNKLLKAALFLFWGMVIALFIMASIKYAGQWHVYLLFSAVSNLLLYFGFRKKAIFFDTFIGIFFWLGFWLKLTIRVAFSGGLFNQAVGYFDGSGAAFDKALLVASCGLSGFLLASFLRDKVFFHYPEKIEGIQHKGLFEFYRHYRKTIWILFIAMFVFVGVTNAYLGIYQRGSITRTILPFGLNGVYKWLLLFGLASISAVILRFEFELGKKTSWTVVILSLLESFVTNISLLSRGMILNVGALLYGISKCIKINSISLKFGHLMITLIVLPLFFIGSVYFVNYLRADKFNDFQTEQEVVQEMHASTTPLFIDRWVGIEGVMAVSSYPQLGWELWRQALNEVYDENQTSFYDNSFIVSSYVKTDKSKHHFISLPGVIAFAYYPGSFSFLFLGMFFLGGVAAFFEYATYKLGGMNVILCALLAQVIAFRFASFGYVPRQSYLLFGTIFLNLTIIYLADKVFLRFSKKRAGD